MRREDFQNNPLLKHSFDFALAIIEYCEELEANKKYIVARQLLKSGTSIGANSMETQGAESKADFIHKIKVAAKEAEETQYWLWLCDYAANYPACKHLISKAEEINRILGKIIATSKPNSSTKKTITS
jgi:four helix bundle protein